MAVPVILGLLALAHGGGSLPAPAPAFAFDGVCCHALDEVCALSVAAPQVWTSSPTSCGLPERGASEGISAGPLERPPRLWG